MYLEVDDLSSYWPAPGCRQLRSHIEPDRSDERVEGED